MKNYFFKQYKLIIVFTLLFAGQTFFSGLNVNAQNSRQLIQTDNNENRIALVIGNGDYKHTSTLNNPVNDATDVSNALKSIGFEVISGTNQSKRGMEILIREFGEKLVKKGGVGLFYYAGHGVQVSGRNYLIPVDAEIPQEDEVDYAAVPIDFVLSKMQTANNSLNLIILDACRNNPFARSWRNFRDIGDSKGLAKISPPTGTLVLYATRPGNVASDGTGRNGLFTSALLNQIKSPGIEYDRLVKQISTEVWEKSNKKQLPWKEGNSLVDFYFVAGGKNSAEIQEKEISKPQNPISDKPIRTETQQSSGVKIDDIKLSFKSNLFDDAINKGKSFLSDEPENGEVNAIVGYSLLTKNDTDQSIAYLSKAIKSGQPILLPIKRGREGSLGIGHQIADSQITVAKDTITIKDGDKLFQAPISDLNVTLGNFGGQCPVAVVKGNFAETRIKSNKNKEASTKEFTLFPLTAALVAGKQGTLDVQLISCSDNGVLPISIVKLINSLKSSI